MVAACLSAVLPAIRRRLRDDCSEIRTIIFSQKILDEHFETRT